MSTPTAPFRADHVGSLLRPDAVKAARKLALEDRRMEPEELAHVEDEAIRDMVAMQEAAGLPVVTDGEIRRSFWHYDFMSRLTGLELEAREEGVAFHGVKLRPIFPVIRERLDFPDDHPMLGHYKFLASVAKVQPKISIPGPSCCHFRVSQADLHPPEYRDPEVFFDDLARTYAKAVAAFYAAGCRYLQLDDIFFAYLCDPKHRADKAATGQDPDWLIGKYAETMQAAIAARPADMVIGMHMCRGNFRSTHAAEGAYDLVADTIFNRIGVDVYFMEYDDERAGGLDPLGLLPKGKKRVMPGFITTKRGALESVDDLRRRFDAVALVADLDQFGIAPQCGFASTEEGNAISFDDQRRKLDLVVETAEKIWGGVTA